MQKTKSVFLMAICTILFTMIIGNSLAQAEEKKDFRVAWSHYTGWEPWAYADESGILKKWAGKYGIKIKLELVNDYMESINLYTGGTYDAVVMTNMDALTTPAVGGIDSEVVIVGDYSNGNDGIVLRNGATVADIRGRKVRIVELSVSHYLLARAFAMNGLKESDVTIVNTSDRDIAGLFTTDTDPKAAVVTWNPPLMQVRNVRGATLVFDSSKIPGEILDLMVVKTNAPASLKKALTGAWYEVMGIMAVASVQQKAAIASMAKTAGGTDAEFRAQLKTTRMYYDPKDAVAFTTSPDIQKTMEFVRTFCFDHGLFGQGSKTKDEVGISFPDGSVMGRKDKVKFRFTADYMRMAAEGKL